MFNNDPEVVALTAQILPLVAIFQGIYRIQSDVEARAERSLSSVRWSAGCIRWYHACLRPSVPRCTSEPFVRHYCIERMQALTFYRAYYVIGIPIGIYLAFTLHLGLAGLWIGLTLSLMYCAAFGLYICLIKTDWDRELRKVEARLEADKNQSADEERLLQ
jgi:MATE family multidrug resistance protein